MTPTGMTIIEYKHRRQRKASRPIRHIEAKYSYIPEIETNILVRCGKGPIERSMSFPGDERR